MCFIIFFDKTTLFNLIVMKPADIEMEKDMFKESPDNKDKKTAVSLASKPRANPAVVEREATDGEAVLVNLDTAASLALNRTGFLIWKLVDGKRTIEQIIDAVRQRFPEAPPQVINDVSVLMETLAEDGFVGFEWTKSNKKEHDNKKESAL